MRRLNRNQVITIAVASVTSKTTNLTTIKTTKMKIISAISSALHRNPNQTQPTKMKALVTLTSPQLNHSTKSLNLMITSQLKALVTLNKTHHKRMMMTVLGILTINKTNLPV